MVQKMADIELEFDELESRCYRFSLTSSTNSVDRPVAPCARKTVSVLFFCYTVQLRPELYQL